MTAPGNHEDNQGRAVAKGCLLILLFIGFIIAGGSFLIWQNRGNLVESVSTGVQNLLQLPYYGEAEFIDLQYGELLRTLDLAAQNSTSYFGFAAIVEQLPLPEEVVYVAIKQNDDETAFVKKIDWHSQSKVVVQGYGAGKLQSSDGSIDVMIYQNHGPWNYMDAFVVYILHDSGTAIPDSF